MTSNSSTPKRQLVHGPKAAVCQCDGRTETPYVCSTCRTPLCTACADNCGCPRCDLTDEGFAPDCTQ